MIIIMAYIFDSIYQTEALGRPSVDCWSVMTRSSFIHYLRYFSPNNEATSKINGVVISGACGGLNL